jgi:hypothetical protein
VHRWFVALGIGLFVGLSGAGHVAATTATRPAAYDYDAPIMTRAATAALLGGPTSLSATAPRAAVTELAHEYDRPTTTRPEAPHVVPTEAGTGLFSDVWDGSAPPPVEPSGVSMTPYPRNNATKWVDDAGKIRWPGNRGFAGTPVDYVLDVGTRGVGVSPVA